MSDTKGNLYYELAEGHYGALALKRTVGPNLLRGLAISFLVHTLVVISPYIISLFQGEEVIPPPPTRVVDMSEIVKLRSNQNTQDQVQIAVPKMAVPKATIPIAVPLDEIEVDLEKTLMPSQKELVQQLGAGGSDETGLGLNPGELIEIREEKPDADEIPAPNKFIPMEFPPQPLPDFSAPPKYPKMAQNAGVKGRVVVQAYVDKTGTVKKIIIKSASPKDLGFEEEVTKAINEWRFTPAIQNGKPVGVWVEMPFAFQVGD